MSQLDQYLAYLDSHSEDDVKVVSFKEWKAAQPFIRHCSCGGTIATSTDRCNQCSAPSTELQEGMTMDRCDQCFVSIPADDVCGGCGGGPSSEYSHTFGREVFPTGNEAWAPLS